MFMNHAAIKMCKDSDQQQNILSSLHYLLNFLGTGGPVCLKELFYGIQDCLWVDSSVCCLLYCTFAFLSAVQDILVTAYIVKACLR